jgi:hypothetical protein
LGTQLCPPGHKCAPPFRRMHPPLGVRAPPMCARLGALICPLGAHLCPLEPNYAIWGSFMPLGLKCAPPLRHSCPPRSVHPLLGVRTLPAPPPPTSMHSYPSVRGPPPPPPPLRRMHLPSSLLAPPEVCDLCPSMRTALFIRSHLLFIRICPYFIRARSTLQPYAPLHHS